MIIHTFFSSEGCIPDQGKVINHWHKSWVKRGWEPRMLNPRTYSKHPQKKECLKRLEAFDPITRFSMLSYLAMDAEGSHSCWFSEYDVINYKFDAHAEDPYDDSTSLLFSQGLFHVGSGVARGIVERFVIGKSPVFIASKMSGSESYGSPDWLSYPVTHFSREACAGVPKHQVIESCGRFY